MNRRAFLRRSAAVVSALPLAVRASHSAGMMAAERPLEQPAPTATPATRGSSFDPWIEIEPRHLAENVADVARFVGGRPILAVIKNNGYGLGVELVAEVLSRLPHVRGLAVVKLQEAMAIRDAGVKTPVLLMGPYDERDLEDMQARDIMPMVYTPIGAALERVASRAGRPLRVHVCVDTGLGREGVPYRDAPALIRDLAGRKGLQIDGLMMTFSEDRAYDREQLSRFETLTASLRQSKVGVGARHAASSYTFFQHDDVWLDMVRPGMALFGVYPDPSFRAAKRLTLRPAGAFRTRVVLVKQLAAGESAGYERAYLATQDVWIATLPVGHADGWPRAAAKGATVRIGAKRYPVIASVSASHTLVEIGRDPEVAIGDVATLWDWQDGSRPEDVSVACGASVYDLLMHLGGHLSRRLL
jgi:alanine racemase